MKVKEIVFITLFKGSTGSIAKFRFMLRYEMRIACVVLVVDLMFVTCHNCWYFRYHLQNVVPVVPL